MSSGLTISVIGAGGKMGMRISDNLVKSPHNVYYCDNNATAQERVRHAGRDLTDNHLAVAESDAVILAVPDVALGAVSKEVVPLLPRGAILLTLDPAASYAGLISLRDDVYYAVAHPCHPSVFLERTTADQWADSFGGRAAPQDVVAAVDMGDDAVRCRAEEVIRTIYSPVIDVHWVSVKQLAVLEPTVTETVTCMIGAFLKDVLWEAVNIVGVPEAAARSMLLGHAQIALTNSLRGSNPFSEAALIAMAYGRQTIIKDDWKKIFEYSELDSVIARMLQIERVQHPEAVA